MFRKYCLCLIFPIIVVFLNNFKNIFSIFVVKLLLAKRIHINKNVLLYNYSLDHRHANFAKNVSLARGDNVAMSLSVLCKQRRVYDWDIKCMTHSTVTTSSFVF